MSEALQLLKCSPTLSWAAAVTPACEMAALGRCHLYTWRGLALTARLGTAPRGPVHFEPSRSYREHILSCILTSDQVLSLCSCRNAIRVPAITRGRSFRPPQDPGHISW